MQRFQSLRQRSVWQRTAVFAERPLACASFRVHNVNAVRLFSSLPDHEVVGLPALSPTMEAGTIAKWIKKEGDQITAGDVVCEIETDKAVVEYEAQDDSFLAKILKDAGSGEIKVGEPIFVTVDSADAIEAFKDFSPNDSSEAALPPSKPEASEAPKTSAPAAEEAPKAQKPSTPAAPSRSSSSDRVFASPLAKKIARESGAVLSVINGSGPHGRIVKADVEEAIARGDATQEKAPAAEAESAAPAAPSATHDYTDYPISSEAQQLAQELTQRKLDTPHYHLTVDLTIDKLLDARARLNAGRAEDAQLSVNDFIVRAASLAMQKVPEVNSSWKGTFIRQYNDVSINLIVTTAAGGSVAPVIPAVNRKGLSDINKIVRDVVSKANEDGLTSENLANGTFTISNVGMYDIRSLAGIVRADQSCLLGVGTIEKKVVPNDDPDATQIYKYAQIMSVTLACDHRVVDGALGAQWLAVFKELVEDPLKMIL